MARRLADATSRRGHGREGRGRSRCELAFNFPRVAEFFCANGACRTLPSGVCRTVPGMARTARLELRVAPELLAAVDAARGDVSRSRWVVRALESALDREGAPDASPGSLRERVMPSAPSRASAVSTAEKELGGLRNVAGGQAVRPSGVVRASSLVRDPVQMAKQAGLNKAKGL